MKELTLAEKLFKKLSKKERDKVKLEQKKAEIEAKAHKKKKSVLTCRELGR